MAAQRKTILIAGLGPTISKTAQETLNVDPSKTLELVAAEVEKAKVGGFDCSVFIVEPWDPETTLAKLRDELHKQHWDGLSIGHGLRALDENTRLFEDVINAAVEVSPKTKLVFPLGREDIWVAIQRAFGVQA